MMDEKRFTYWKRIRLKMISILIVASTKSHMTVIIEGVFASLTKSQMAVIVGRLPLGIFQ